MDIDLFEKRLLTGKTNHLLYSKHGKDGLVAVWIHESHIILTWEECPKGCQYDESTYTRNERHSFETIHKLIIFLAQNDLNINLFSS